MGTFAVDHNGSASVITGKPAMDDDSIGMVIARREVLKQAMDSLAGAANGEGDLAMAISALEVAFVRHVHATESPTGLFAEVVGDAPRLAHAVDRLRHDHEEITTAIRGLQRAPSPSGAAEVLDQLERHRHLGATLVYDAYNIDVSVGD